MRVDIYTDGAARGNPGRGGYGSVLCYQSPSGKTHMLELSRGYQCTTNNRMELMGVIAAIEALKQPCELVVHSDSQYVVRAFTERWIDAWQAKGWKTASKQPVKNVDLWKRLLAVMNQHEVRFVWVKGHAGHPLNERCDSLATQAADGDELLVDTGFRAEM
ncbi:ribonuclease HI [Collinsella sp. zg1085]|uniref:ribonuclease HI n=1 Tax=Collinsella sp. zg1085 TaxID=2844380 RepID=UPI001C0E2ACC|nr:ribonuclease HI [Collinsella sp. zg1085]QWT18158.1 ribonuclease HI [Collinsella sp. zg1085]